MAFVRVNNSGLKDSSSIRFREYKKKIKKIVPRTNPKLILLAFQFADWFIRKSKVKSIKNQSTITGKIKRLAAAKKKLTEKVPA